MRVTIYPADTGGCGHYRLIYPAQVLQADGMDVQIEVDGKLPALVIDVPGDDGVEQRIVGCAQLETDVVVLQRPLTADIYQLIPHIQKQGIAVVVEVDDDFTCIPPGNPAFAHCHPRLSPQRNWHHLNRAIALADMVTVSTSALARRYGQHGRVAVLPNYVPQRYLDIIHPLGVGDPPVIGWTGTPLTHVGDLEQVGPGLARAMFGTDARFRALGSRFTAGVLGVEGDWVEWNHDLSTYVRDVARLDIGLVPLHDSAFNRAKSWLKGLEYAALGVAFVASPTPEYRSLVKMGAGILASRPREWEKQIRALIEDETYRIVMAESGRAVARRMTYEAHAGAWWEAWEMAFDHRAKSASKIAVHGGER